MQEQDQFEIDAQKDAIQYLSLAMMRVSDEEFATKTFGEWIYETPIERLIFGLANVALTLMAVRQYETSVTPDETLKQLGLSTQLIEFGG